MIIEVGKRLSNVICVSEGVRFQADTDGYMLIYSFKNPSKHEIAQMGEGMPFEIAFVRKGLALWLLTKCGALKWTDAPFHPALAPQWKEYPITLNGGIALTLIMIDSQTQIVKSLRLIGLGHDFSINLQSEIAEMAKLPFDLQAYNVDIVNTMSAYSTKNLFSMSTNKWRLRMEQ